MWEIQILWNGWVTVQTGFNSRDDAQWAIAEWKQKNECVGDPFRAVESKDDADASDRFLATKGQS